MGHYLVVGIESGIFWPAKNIRVSFGGYDILMRPATRDRAPSIVLEYEPPMTTDEALLIARRFLSSLSWVERGCLREIMVTGGGIPVHVGRGSTNHINPYFRINNLPDPQNQKARLALALYREALGVNSVPYRFLGFFKIITVLYKKRSDQIGWINRTIGAIRDSSAMKRISDLPRQHKNVGKYLHDLGRCAVAHAYTNPVVDPDDPSDTSRLTADLPVIQSLAEYIIEHEFAIPRR